MRRQERKPPARKADGRGARGAETTVGGVGVARGWVDFTCHFALVYFSSDGLGDVELATDDCKIEMAMSQVC